MGVEEAMGMGMGMGCEMEYEMVGYCSFHVSCAYV